MRRNLLLCLTFATLAVVLSASRLFAQQYSLRFYGNGYRAPGQDRVKIPLDHPNRPVDVAKDFTIEFWMKTDCENNNGLVFATNNGDGWENGNVILDRSIIGPGDYGEYGLSIGSHAAAALTTRVIAFGIAQSETGITIVGKTNIADNQWHHVAVTRNSYTGLVTLFVDGNPDAQGIGPTGHIDYENNRPTDYPNTDPFLVIGAEKNDAGINFPSYNGYIDEMRICSNIRYRQPFTPPHVEFGPDQKTVAIYHFNEGSGTVAHDNSEFVLGSSDGTLYIGGTPPGPQWSTESPFDELRPAIKEIKNDLAGVSIYPNPSHGEFRVVLPDKNIRVTVYDATHHEIFARQFENAGTYSIQLGIGNKKVVPSLFLLKMPRVKK